MEKDPLYVRMLKLMSDGEWHSTDELIEKISHRFSASMYTLKKRGYRFAKRSVGGHRYEYRLISDEQKAIA